VNLQAHTKELENLIGKLHTLSEMTELVSRIPNINEVLQIVLRRTMASVNAKIGSIMLIDEESQVLTIATSEGLDESLMNKTKVALGEGIAGKVAQSGETLLVEDVAQDLRFQKINDPKYDTGSFICMPLRSHTRVMGVLNLSKKGNKKLFSESDVSFLTTLLGHIGFALENARLLQKAKGSAIKLNEMVKKQDVQLEQAREEAAQSLKLFQQAQKMEAIGTLAGGIAHDYNNLLMGIQGNASLALVDIDPSHPHYGKLKNIEQYVQSASTLTKQLLGLSMKGKYDVKPIDLHKLITKSSDMFGRTKKEIKIQREYGNDIWTVEVDKGQLEQVLLNLYVNAWQAMLGSANLTIKTKNVTLDENYVKPYSLQSGNYVKISVTDTGVGMDETTQQRIFEPFFTTKEMGRGTGLGLASVYGIIKNHFGFININSEKGKGTTFNIFLPASEKEVTEETELSKEVLQGSETVLLLDDEDLIIDVGKQFLEKMGYKVLIAKSGTEAIDIYKKNSHRIDMVIIDIIMPDMGGGEAYDRLKEINPEIKVLLSSGYSINGQATEILERGCQGFIQKPFKLKDLSKKLREILD
jgi:signal transduction histidine kinase/CheY-like chemotaxis protein